MKLAALSSGGKDSLYAVYLAEKAGHPVSFMLSMVPESDESYMFHHPNIEYTEVQAELMDVPLVVGKTLGEKEKELADLEDLMQTVASEVDGFVTGAIASEYQRSRIEGICEKLGKECLSPLWGVDLEKYWGDLLSSGFSVLVSRVAAEGLGKEWLGRVIDEEAVEELKRIREKHHINLAFEGGEAETFVLDCPMFSKKIEVADAESRWEGQSGTYAIKEIATVRKDTS